MTLHEPNWEIDEYDFVCPINLTLMEDPCMIPCGHSFERSVIEEWFQRCGDLSVCPMRCELKEKTITPNTSLKARIQKFKGRHNANQTPPYAILFLGNTGVAKSHLTEDLVGQGDLADSSVESGTSKVTPYKTQSGLIVIDTPGLADTEGKTLEYLDAIVKEASSRRCLPAIVVKYGDKIGPQCVACLEALSICLDLGNYVLIINNITSGQRGKTKQVDVIAQMISKVTEIIGGPPVKTIPHWNGSLFTEDKLLLPLPVCISSKVSTLKQLWKATSTKHARIEKIRQQMHQYMLCKQNLLEISSTMGKDGLSRLAHGPSELRSSIATNFEYRHYGRAALGALALPLAEVGHRIVGGCELLSLLLTSPAELVIDGVKINWQRPTANEQRFLVHNQERVEMLFNKLENVRKFYTAIQKTSTAPCS